MKHSTRCFIRYPYTSKSVLKNSATLRFSTHFSVFECQISTQLNRNKAWLILILKSRPTLITTGCRGILKESNFSVDLYEINFGELYFY